MATPPRPLVQALERHPFLADTSPDVLARLAARSRLIDAEPGLTIVDFKDATTEVYLVIQGSVRVLVRTADGEQTQILGDLSAGDLVGEMSAIDDVPRSARIEALVRTRLCVIPNAAFLEVVFASPAVGLRLLRLLTARVRGQNRRLLEQTALPIRLRLAAELLRLSRPRQDGTRSLSPPPTQEELAARIGTRRETVSRELSALTQAGLLRRTRAAFVMEDPSALQAVISAGLDQPAGYAIGRPTGTR